MKLAHLLGFCGMLGASAAVLAAPPSNDTCTSPLAIGPGVHNFNATEATLDSPASCVFSTEGADLWYLYTAVNSGTAEVNFTSISADCSPVSEMAATLFATTSCSSAEVNCRDLCNREQLRFRVVAGTSYLLRITTGVKAASKFSIVEQASPGNDQCANATPVGPANNVYTWNTRWALGDAPFPSCGSTNNINQWDVWYAYTAASTGNVAIDVGTNNGTTLTVFDGSCAGPEIFCGYLGGGQVASVYHWAGFPVTAGHTYIIRVARTDAPNTTTRRLNIREFTPPTNDTCGQVQAMSALTLTAEGTAYNYNNAGALDTGPMETWSDCGQIHGSIWYKFTAPQAGVAIFEAPSNDGGVQLSAYSSCNTSAIRACGTGFINFDVAAGETMYVRVGQLVNGGFSNYYRAGTLTASLIPPLVNDTCAGATPINGNGVIVLNNRNALTNTTSPAVPTCAEAATALTHDIWYSWSSPESGTLVLSTCGVEIGDQIYDTVLAVYNGCGGAPIACDDHGGNLGAINIPGLEAAQCTDYQSYVEVKTEADTQYNVRLSGYPWGQGRLHVQFVPDSGNLLATAVTVQAAPQGQPTIINSTIASAHEVDIYKIRICDINNFSVSTDFPETTFNTQLFLFDANGRGVTHNDNFDIQQIKSKLSDQYINEEGDYYLAVCGSARIQYNASSPGGSVNSSRRPVSASGPIWSGFFPSTETDADGDGSDDPVIGWIGLNNAVLYPLPAYRLVIEGICSSCPADFNGDNTRDVADLFAYINAWLAKTANANFNGDGSVDVADLFAYINAWLAGC